MENKINYKSLYEIQDRVLDAVFSADNTFYLTGGTCINRFYNEKRYSDDLDFFTGDNNLFREMIAETTQFLEEKNFKKEIIVDSRDFVRLQIDGILKVDFVNDRVFYSGKKNRLESGYRLDNPVNMLANKLTAVIGRDEPKDIIDLFILALCTEFSWTNIVEIASQKSPVDNEILEYRLKTFPLNMLDNLSVVDIDFLDIVKSKYPILINDIISGNENTFFKL